MKQASEEVHDNSERTFVDFLLHIQSGENIDDLPLLMRLHGQGGGGEDKRANRREDQRFHRRRYPSFFFSSSFTSAGLAFPLLAFITWPTKKPNSLSLPLR